MKQYRKKRKQSIQLQKKNYKHISYLWFPSKSILLSEKEVCSELSNLGLGFVLLQHEDGGFSSFRLRSCKNDSSCSGVWVVVEGDWSCCFCKARVLARVRTPREETSIRSLVEFGFGFGFFKYFPIRLRMRLEEIIGMKLWRWKRRRWLWLWLLKKERERVS